MVEVADTITVMGMWQQLLSLSNFININLKLLTFYHKIEGRHLLTTLGLILIQIANYFNKTQ